MNESKRRLLMLTLGNEQTANVRVRALALIPYFKKAGFDVTVRSVPQGGQSFLKRGSGLIGDMMASRKYDAVLLFRKTFPALFAAGMAKTAVPLIYDFDDAVWLPSPGETPGREETYRKNFEATLGMAALCWGGSRTLCEEARRLGAQAELVPTAVDTERFHPALRKKPGEDFVLGWVGHSDNLPYLRTLHKPLRNLCERYSGLSLRVVCNEALELEGVRIENRPWSLESETEAFAGLDAGLMPLVDTPWARGKCAYKILQYMACAIPALASPVGANTDVVEDGVNGKLCTDALAWEGAIEELIENREKGRVLGGKGRETVEKRYALEAVAKTAIESVQTLLNI